eukprot:1640153-Rhodomonas_salina.1
MDYFYPGAKIRSSFKSEEIFCGYPGNRCRYNHLYTILEFYRYNISFRSQILHGMERLYPGMAPILVCILYWITESALPVLQYPGTRGYSGGVLLYAGTPCTRSHFGYQGTTDYYQVTILPGYPGTTTTGVASCEDVSEFFVLGFVGMPTRKCEKPERNQSIKPIFLDLPGHQYQVPRYTGTWGTHVGAWELLHCVPVPICKNSKISSRRSQNCREGRATLTARSCDP